MTERFDSFERSLDTKLDDFTSSIKLILKRIDRLESKVADLESVRIRNSRVEGIEASIESLLTKVQDLQQKIDSKPDPFPILLPIITPEHSPDALKKLRKAQNKMEDQMKEKNIIIYGLERGTLNAEDGHPTIATNDFFNNKLNCDIPFEKASWGKGDNPPLFVKLNDTTTKRTIFRNCHKLKGTRISVQEDFCRETRMQRRFQLDDFKRLRAIPGNKVYFRRGDLIINGRVHDPYQDTNSSVTVPTSSS
jgi:hypothetical protein